MSMDNVTFMTFNISRLGPDRVRIFNGIVAREWNIDFSSPKACGQLIQAVWGTLGKKSGEAVAFAKQCHAHLAAGSDHAGPTDEELRLAYDIAHPGSQPVLRCVADIAAREVAWLWRDRIPLGRLTLLVGRPGEGKSFLACDIAARVSRGAPFPDGADCPEGSVILVSAEDDPADTIRPRLDAHKANVRRIHLLSAVRYVGEDGTSKEVMFTLADVAAIESALKALVDCRLIVVDPIGSVLGGRVDAHRDNEVRSVLAPIARLAEKYGVAVLIIAHRRKAGGDHADDLALGSRAFTGIARAVWHLVRDPEQKERRLLLSGKNNLSVEGNGLAFTIAGNPAVLAWEANPITMNADDALATSNRDGEESREGARLGEAQKWLRELLAVGPLAAKDIQRQARECGIASRTLARAKREENVRAYRPNVPGPWYWGLPEECRNSSAPDTDREPLGNVGNLADFAGDSPSSLPQDCQGDPLGSIEGESDAETEAFQEAAPSAYAQPTIPLPQTRETPRHDSANGGNADMGDTQMGEDDRDYSNGDPDSQVDLP